MRKYCPIKVGSCLFLSSLTLLAGSCSPEQTSATSDFALPSFGPTPRQLQVGFFNNTPYRAIFTAGSYDPLNKETLPDFGQIRLEGNTSSSQLTGTCRKVFSVGGAELIRLIETNENNPAVVITDPLALVDGVNFSAAPLGDPLEAEPTEGTAEGLTLRNGIDYTCLRTNINDTTGTALLTFTFEEDAAAPGGFRIDFTLVLP